MRFTYDVSNKPGEFTTNSFCHQMEFLFHCIPKCTGTRFVGGGGKS